MDAGKKCGVMSLRLRLFSGIFSCRHLMYAFDAYTGNVPRRWFLYASPAKEASEGVLCEMRTKKEAYIAFRLHASKTIDDPGVQ